MHTYLQFQLEFGYVFYFKMIIGRGQLQISCRLPQDGFSPAPSLGPRDPYVLVSLREARIIQMT